MLSIAELKKRMPSSAQLFPKRSDWLVVEEGKPVTFFVLCEQYSSKGVWFHPAAVHFDKKKMTVCSELPEMLGACPVCDRVRAMKAAGTNSFRIEASVKFAVNVLVRGEETPKVFLAPRTVAVEIIRAFEGMLEEKLNIFDPHASHGFTVNRSKANGRTVYEVDVALEPEPIIVGGDVEKRIERILKAGANLDQRFRVPTR
jgi:hypothetical protein